MRLLTRSDFDGLACAVLLKEKGLVDSREFVHPKDVQDGLVEVTKDDILVNLPYVEGCGLWFDHHSSEEKRLELRPHQFKGISGEAPSTARLIYHYYGGQKTFKHLEELMEAVDKADSGSFSKEEILNPTKWVLLSFIMDPRTGLGRFRDYRISNYQLMDDMIEYCRNMSIEEILAVPDVQERVHRYYEQTDLYKEMVHQYSYTQKNALITDLRGVETIHSGNRFLIYTLYPEQNISIWVIDGKQKQNCVFAVGHSIINKTSKTDVGDLMLKYEGGGHKKVGTCQVPYEKAQETLTQLLEKINEDG